MSTTLKLIIVTACAALLDEFISTASSSFDVINEDYLETCGHNSIHLARFHNTIAYDSLATSSAQEVVWKLGNESCIDILHSNDHLNPVGPVSMCRAFQGAEEQDGCAKPHYLSKAECLAVYMYSTNFHKTYNQNVRNRNWEPYKVFSALLYSAIKKISHNNPLPKEITLYKGLNKPFLINTTEPFYFTQFVSTSLSNEDFARFGSETSLIFIIPKLAANVNALTQEGEQVVLLTPFEAFEVIRRTESTVYLKSSDAQEFYFDEFDLRAFFEAVWDDVRKNSGPHDTSVSTNKSPDDEQEEDCDDDDDDYDFDLPWC